MIYFEKWYKIPRPRMESDLQKLYGIGSCVVNKIFVIDTKT